MSLVDDLKKRLASLEEETAQPKLDLVKSQLVKVTVAEIKAAVEACPCKDHCPCCKSFVKGTRGFPDDHTFFVEAIDLQAVLEGKEVIHNVRIEDGRKVRTKELGPPHKSTPVPAKPKEPVK